MSRFTALRTLTIVVSSALLCRSAAAQATHDTADRAQLVAWARHAAMPIGPLDSSSSRLDPTRVGTFTRTTRVVGMGESVHGTHELMLVKRRMTEQLMQRDQLAAVVLESVSRRGA